MDINTIKDLFQKCKGITFQLDKEIEQCKDKKEKLERRLKLLEKAQAFLQKIAQETQEQLKFQIEDIVNLALETCFPGEYTFEVKFEILRGKTEAELVFLDQKTGRQVDPMEASGGGVVDLTTFALRIACFALEQGTDNVIVLDEPFRFLSRDLQQRAGEILKTLSERMNLQVIMVSHIGEIIDVADKIFEVRKIDGVSKVKIVETN
jgi:DNA repair exonuclease SbcCD ATPase subunit